MRYSTLQIHPSERTSYPDGTHTIFRTPSGVFFMSYRLERNSKVRTIFITFQCNDCLGITNRNGGSAENWKRNYREIQRTLSTKRDLTKCTNPPIHQSPVYWIPATEYPFCYSFGNGFSFSFAFFSYFYSFHNSKSPSNRRWPARETRAWPAPPVDLPSHPSAAMSSADET